MFDVMLAGKLSTAAFGSMQEHFYLQLERLNCTLQMAWTLWDQRQAAGE